MTNLNAITANTHTAGHWLAIAALTALFSVAARAAPPSVDAGEWQVTWHQQSIKGRQGPIPLSFLDLQTLNRNVCLDQVPALPLPPGVVSGCKSELESAVAETITWRATCSDNARVAGRIRHRGAAMDGTLNIETDEVALTYEVKGRWRRAGCR